MYLKQIESYVPRNDQEYSDKKIIYHFCQENPHNVLLRSNRVAHLTSSGFIMNRELTKVLMIYHKIYQSWGWTGGHMDGDDDMLAVAIKEAKEETGLKELEVLSEDVMSIDILPVWGHKKLDRYISAHLHYNCAYILIGDETAPLIVNEEETEGVMWVDVCEMEAYATEPDLIPVYMKLVEAARGYDKTKTTIRYKSPEQKEKLIKDLVVPIALYETQSGYYKLRLAKEILGRGATILSDTLKNRFEKTNEEKKDGQRND